MTSVQQDLHQVLQNLSISAISLRQLAEQNWITAESMLDSMGIDDDDEIQASRTTSSGPRELIREKRMLAEIQEELAIRIENLQHMTNQEGKDAFELASTSSSDEFVSMKDYCENLLNGKDQNNKQASSSSSSGESQQVEASPPAPAAAESSSEVGGGGGSPSMLLSSSRRTTGDPSWSAASSGGLSPAPFSLAQKSCNSSQVDEDDDDEEEEDMEEEQEQQEDDGEPAMEMTQNTENAVAALAVLASGHRM
jgi:hypothetical protein